jgi:hypothetical protein
MSGQLDMPHVSPALPMSSKARWRWHHWATQCPIVTQNCDGYETHVYCLPRGPKLVVLSSAIVAEYRGEPCRHNHVSVAVADHTRRPTDPELAMVRADFDMADAEEDNHSPGNARHLFLPLHIARGTVGVCDCKDDEEQVVESDGYTWSRGKVPNR